MKSEAMGSRQAAGLVTRGINGDAVEAQPVLLINERASSADLLAEIGDVLGETEAFLVAIGASLDSRTGAPNPEIITTALWAIQRQYALLRRYLAVLQAKQTSTAP